MRLDVLDFFANADKFEEDVDADYVDGRFVDCTHYYMRFSRSTLEALCDALGLKTVPGESIKAVIEKAIDETNQ